MKEKEMKFPLNIQFFAEDDDDKGEPEKKEGKEQTFEEMIASNPSFQSEFDKKVASAVESNKQSWEKDFEARMKAMVDDSLTEKEKLEQMNDKQKAEYEQQKKIDELTKRERELEIRELGASAKETLAEKGLPLSFGSLLNYESAETVSQSMEIISKAWNDELAKAKIEFAKGNKVPGNGDTPDESNPFIKAMKKATNREL